MRLLTAMYIFCESFREEASVMTVLMYQMEYGESTYRAEIRPWSKVCGSKI